MFGVLIDRCGLVSFPDLPLCIFDHLHYAENSGENLGTFILLWNFQCLSRHCKKSLDKKKTVRKRENVALLCAKSQ